MTGGVRRLALSYDIKLGDRQFSRKPGVWDPLVGVAYHGPSNRKMVWHAVFETAGYNFMYIKLTNEVLIQTFTVKQAPHGPVLASGFISRFGRSGVAGVQEIKFSWAPEFLGSARPRVERHHPCRFEVGHVARDDNHAVNQRGRGD